MLPLCVCFIITLSVYMSLVFLVFFFCDGRWLARSTNHNWLILQTQYKYIERTIDKYQPLRFIWSLFTATPWLCVGLTKRSAASPLTTTTLLSQLQQDAKYSKVPCERKHKYVASFRSSSSFCCCCFQLHSSVSAAMQIN